MWKIYKYVWIKSGHYIYRERARVIMWNKISIQNSCNAIEGGHFVFIKNKH